MSEPESQEVMAGLRDGLVFIEARERGKSLVVCAVIMRKSMQLTSQPGQMT